MLADEVWNFRSEATRVVDGTRRHLVRADDTVLNTDAVIVFTERRGLVDDASTVLGGDIRIVEHKECPVLELIPKLARNF